MKPYLIGPDTCASNFQPHRLPQPARIWGRNREDEGRIWDNALTAARFCEASLQEGNTVPTRLMFLRAAVTLSLLSICAQPAAVTGANVPNVAQPRGKAESTSARDVVGAVLGAYGGPARIKEHKERATRSHGAINSTSSISSAENSYDCVVLEKGDNVRVEMNMLGIPMVMAYDGKHSWTQHGDWVAAATPAATALISDELKHGLPALVEALSPTTKIQLLPSQAVQGKGCDVFKITTSAGDTTTFYADKQDHLIIRADYVSTDHELGSKTLQSIDYSDYRTIAGSPEPFRVVQRSGNKKKTETVIKSIEADPSIDDKTFQMPPESEVARVKDAPVAIPFEYTGNEIIIKARINNGPEGRFIVDTGASQSVIDKSAAAALGPHPISTFSITAGSKAVPLSYTKLGSLTMGDISLNDLPVLVTDLSNVGDHPQGLIGANILKRFLVTIDFDEKKLILADPRSAVVPPGAAVIPTSPVFGGTALIVRGKLDDKAAVNFLVDTGASFNNLPQSLAKPLYSGTVMPVGVIYGIDGAKINIGAIKLKSLKLANVSIPSPVFTLAPDGGTPTTGLFTAGAMGILGNPVWSQFKTTIDYRNERLILEPQADREKLAALLAHLTVVDNDFLRNKNAEDALKSYQKIAASAQTAQLKAGEALALSRVADLYSDKYSKTKETQWLEMASQNYDRANKLANESRNKSIEGQVLAQWALMHLNSFRSMNDITGAQTLLQKALQKAPMESSIFAAFGTTLFRVGKKAEAEKLLDRALVLDPANWQALWGKYKLYQDLNRPRERDLVLAQLKYYYPGYPDVTALTRGTADKAP